MKRKIALLIAVILLLICSACSGEKFADVTPTLDAIESISFQRTNIDEAGKYTYFEKTVADVQEIEALCAEIDDLKFVDVDPLKFNSVDYLVVFEGKKDHKLMISGDLIIYDGIAYQYRSKGLKDAVDKIYQQISVEEAPAQSKLFK